MVIQQEFENRIKTALGHSLYQNIMFQTQLDYLQKELDELRAKEAVQRHTESVADI